MTAPLTSEDLAEMRRHREQSVFLGQLLAPNNAATWIDQARENIARLLDVYEEQVDRAEGLEKSLRLVNRRAKDYARRVTVLEADAVRLRQLLRESLGWIEGVAPKLVERARYRGSGRVEGQQDEAPFLAEIRMTLKGPT